MWPVENLDVDWILGDFSGFVPEIFLCGIIVLLIFCSLFKSGARLIFYVAVVGIILHLILIPRIGYSSSIFKFIMSLAALITMLMKKEERMEYYLFIFTILLGADLLLVSNHFIMMLLSIELISISSYVLTAGLNPDKQRAEAAWKFFIYGSVATAVMIFGMTYHYGATGLMSFGGPGQSSPLLTIGGMMTLAGFLFKMTVAPFHLWAPDVYEATPSPIVAFLSVVPKLAAYWVIMSIVGDSRTDWTVAIAAISIFTIVVGTLAALNQTTSKRMMAYSSVAQAGFLLIVPSSAEEFTQHALSPAFYYAIVFAIMNYIVFIVIHENEKAKRGTTYTDFTGIGYTNPLIAVAITLGLVSLAGLPPMAGFMAKLLVFSRLWTKFADTQNLIFLSLFIIGLLATVASLYFYLKIPFYAFFRRSEEKPVAADVRPIKITPFTNLLLLILVGLLLALFLAPGLFDGLA